MLVTAASHHVVGSCSVHPGRGVSRGYSVVATAATCPAESRSTAFAPVVPTSIPNSRGLPVDPGPTAGVLIIQKTCAADWIIHNHLRATTAGVQPLRFGRTESQSR